MRLQRTVILAEELDSLLDSKILRSCKKKKKNLLNGYYVIEIFDISPRIYKFCFYRTWRTMYVCLIKKLLFEMYNIQRRILQEIFVLILCPMRLPLIIQFVISFFKSFEDVTIIFLNIPIFFKGKKIQRNGLDGHFINPSIYREIFKNLISREICEHLIV